VKPALRTLIIAFLAGPLAISPAAVSADGDLIGRPATHLVAQGDSFVAIARTYDVGYLELIAANPGIDPWLPEMGTPLTIPTRHVLPDAPRRGIVINLSEPRLYLFRAAGLPVLTFPAAVGKRGCETPVGETRVVGKRRDPVWVPPESVRQERPWLPPSVAPGPDNPLGRFAIDLGWPEIVVHGTNQPAGVGRRVSHGCVRLYPEDMARLFSLVELGLPVTVVDQPVKLGWDGGMLYLEIHPTRQELDILELGGDFERTPIPELVRAIKQRAGDAAHRVDWGAVRDAEIARTGIPRPVLRFD